MDEDDLAKTGNNQSQTIEWNNEGNLVLKKNYSDEEHKKILAMAIDVKRCWHSDTFTRESCCDRKKSSTGDAACWSGEFTYKRCCRTRLDEDMDSISSDDVTKFCANRRTDGSAPTRQVPPWGHCWSKKHFIKTKKLKY